MKHPILASILFASMPCFAQYNQSLVYNNNLRGMSKDNSANCISAPVAISNESKEVTLDPAPVTSSTDRIYVYYHHKRHRRSAQPAGFADLTDPYASDPVLISDKQTLKQQSQMYRFSANSRDDRAHVCADSLLNLSANINFEKQSEYSGYYPDASKKNYRLVSRKTYRKTARKMYKAEKKERKVARTTGVPVHVVAKG